MRRAIKITFSVGEEKKILYFSSIKKACKTIKIIAEMLNGISKLDKLIELIKAKLN